MLPRGAHLLRPSPVSDSYPWCVTNGDSGVRRSAQCRRDEIVDQYVEFDTAYKAIEVESCERPSDRLGRGL